jgi:hypothetical protein
MLDFSDESARLEESVRIAVADTINSLDRSLSQCYCWARSETSLFLAGLHIVDWMVVVCLWRRIVGRH